MSRRILVIGSANIDLVARVSHCPKPGESLIGSSFATITGGKGANQAVAAARLGAQVTFAGCVGADAFGEMQRRGLAAEGIDVSALKKHPADPTGTAIILVGDDGQNSIIVTPGANYGITPGDIACLEDRMRASDIVMLQLEIPLETTTAALQLARRCGVTSILDAGPAQYVPAEVLALADVVSPNETEAHALTGIAPEDSATQQAVAGALLGQGVQHVVLKLGAAGARAISREEDHIAAAFPVWPVDTTAAGDAFTAALALQWGRGHITEVLRFANATGALATTRHGAQPSLPKLDEVLDFLNKQ